MRRRGLKRRGCARHREYSVGRTPVGPVGEPGHAPCGCREQPDTEDIRIDMIADQFERYRDADFTLGDGIQLL